MRISGIRIHNFRSIKEADIAPADFNVFVGQNNHGKTNLFEAMEWFFEGIKKGQDIRDLVFGKDGALEMFVEVRFTGALDGAAKMKNESNRTKMLDLLGDHDDVAVLRNSADPKKRRLVVGDKEITKLPTGFDPALNDFLPRFEYIDTKKYFEDVAKYSKGTPVAVMLSGVLTTILEGSRQYQDFQAKFQELFGSDASDVRVELDRLSNKVKAYLERQFPDCTKVAFEVNPPVFEDLLKSFDTTVNDGVETSASEKGDGMQRALMLSILQAYSDFRKEREDVGKSFLFFIDEAELHLHPTAQRHLKEVLLDLSAKGDQVFINTHSSVLVVDDHETQKIFKVEKIDRETGVNEISKNEKANIVYDLLGGTPADLLLPRNFLIVEGKSEVALLSEIIARFYSDRPDIQIVPASGDADQAERSINAIEQLFKPLEKSLYADKVVVLLDKPDKAATLDQFLDNHKQLKKSGQVFVLPCSNIEEYYPNREDWRRTKEQVGTMSGHQKVQLARRVSKSITQEEFEKEMGAVYAALDKCWGVAF